MAQLSLKSINTATIRCARFVAVIGLVALLLLSAIILANVLLRWLFSEPIDGVRDWVKLIVAVAIGACLPSVLALRQNVTVRFIGRSVGGRFEAALELFGALIVLIVFAVTVWLLQVYTLELRADGETTENIGMLIWPWWQGVTILFYLSVAVQVLVVIRLVAAFITGRPVSEESLEVAG